MSGNNSNIISKAIDSFLKGTYSKEVEKDVQEWIVDDADFDEKEKVLFEYWNSLDAGPDVAVKQSLKEVNNQIGIRQKQRMRPLYQAVLKYAIAALVVLGFITTIYLYTDSHTDIINVTESLAELFVPYGQQEQVQLADGSDVWINAGSKIAYPENEKPDERFVYLTGEAYFSVAKDSLKPFIVKTDNLSVKVLGTEFNVRDYPDENVTMVTLNEGKVELQTIYGKTVILEPLQQLVYNNVTNEIKVIDVKPDNTSAWKDGRMIFDSVSLNEILRTLERQYDVSVEVDDSLLMEETYSVKFTNNEDIRQVMSVLQDMIGEYSFDVEGNKIKMRKH